MKYILNIILLCLATLDINAVKINKRISGGEVADWGDFPYQGLLIVDELPPCSVTLVSYYNALTAAQCVTHLVHLLMPKFLSNEKYVLLGLSSKNKPVKYLIKRISYHLDFKTSIPYGFRADISVITLSSAVKLRDDIAIINLPLDNADVFPGTKAIVSGFGSTGPFEDEPGNLMRLSLETINLDKCQAKSSLFLTNDHICTMAGKGFGICLDDIGSPLVDINQKTLLGIASVSTFGCFTGDPDVYTKVSSYLSYIHDEIHTSDANDTIHLDTYKLHPAREFE